MSAETEFCTFVVGERLSCENTGRRGERGFVLVKLPCVQMVLSSVDFWGSECLLEFAGKALFAPDFFKEMGWHGKEGASFP